MSKYAIDKSCFDKIIKKRGLEYYNDGMVSEMYNFDSDIYAKINGYTVIIGQKIAYCSCPYNEYNDTCKHLYALLLKIKNKEIPDDLMNKINKMNKKDFRKILRMIIDKNTIKSIRILRTINDPDNKNLSESSESNSE